MVTAPILVTGVVAGLAVLLHEPHHLIREGDRGIVLSSLRPTSVSPNQSEPKH
jgi:hypothetical protein